MTENASTRTNRPSKRRRYRTVMYGSLAVGFVGYVAGLRAELPVVALGLASSASSPSGRAVR